MDNHRPSRPRCAASRFRAYRRHEETGCAVPRVLGRLSPDRADHGEYRRMVCHHLLETFDGKHEIAYCLTVNPERPGRRTKKVSH